MMQVGREQIRGDARDRMVAEAGHVQDYMNGLGDSLLNQVKEYVDQRDATTSLSQDAANGPESHGPEDYGTP
jgi:hypothetical protein